VKECFQGLDFSTPADINRQHSRLDLISTREWQHGRIEDRDYAVSDDIQLIEQHPAWKTIRSIGVVESGREVKGK
jgi:hypothetical protein